MYSRDYTMTQTATAAERTLDAGRRLLRFAFYGRYSTEDRQSPAASHAWQHDQAEASTTGEAGSSKSSPTVARNSDLSRSVETRSPLRLDALQPRLPARTLST